MSKRIIQYLLFREDVRKINRQYQLTRYEIALLDLITARHFANELLTVGDLIRQRGVASSAVLHHAITNLIEKKFLAKIQDQKDRRVARVSLTRLALERCALLDRAIESARLLSILDLE